MVRGPLPFRRRRGVIAVGPLPNLRPWLPAVGVGVAAGFLLYWADVTLYDALFHPVRSLRNLVYGFGEMVLEAFRMLPFVFVATAVAVGVSALTRRLGGPHALAAGPNGDAPANGKESRA